MKNLFRRIKGNDALFIRMLFAYLLFAIVSSLTYFLISKYTFNENDYLYMMKSMPDLQQIGFSEYITLFNSFFSSGYFIDYGKHYFSINYFAIYVLFTIILTCTINPKTKFFTNPQLVITVLLMSFIYISKMLSFAIVESNQHFDRMIKYQLLYICTQDANCNKELTNLMFKSQEARAEIQKANQTTQYYNAFDSYRSDIIIYNRVQNNVNPSYREKALADKKASKAKWEAFIIKANIPLNNVESKESSIQLSTLNESAESTMIK